MNASDSSVGFGIGSTSRNWPLVGLFLSFVKKAVFYAIFLKMQSSLLISLLPSFSFLPCSYFTPLFYLFGFAVLCL